MIQRLEWWQLCLPLIVGASLLEPKPATRAALAGSVPALLGAAALTLGPIGNADYVAATLGLMAAGSVLPLAAASRALRGPPVDARRSLPGALLVVAGAALLAIRSAPTGAAVGLPRIAMWATGAVAAWWAVVLTGRLLRVQRAMGWLDRVLLAPTPPATLRGLSKVSPVAAVLLIAGAALVLVAPHVGLIVVGIVLASVGAELTFRHGVRVPVLTLLTLTLLPVYWLLHTIAGPVGLAVSSLDQVPISPAAARLVAIPLGLIAWAWTGLWPLHGVVRPVLLAPLGAALWLRVAAPIAGEGLAHWQPLVMAVIVAGLWHAAGDGRLASVLVALGFAALASLGPESAPAAVILLAAAFAFKLPRPAAGPARAAFNLIRRLGFAASAAGAGLAFVAGLRAEVVLTVLAGAGLAHGYRAASPVNDL